MARYVQAPNLTQNQALYVLECALTDRKLTASDIRGYMSRLTEEIRSLEARIADLRSAGSESTAVVVVAGSSAPKLAVRKKKQAVSPKRAASMQLQGQYLGLLAKQKPRDRARFKKLAKEEGRDKAIQAMRKA